jgi:acetyl esterase/lipase
VPRALLAAAVLAWSPLLAEERPVVPLWPGDAPGSEGKTDPEKVEGGRVSRVHRPSLTAYLPPRATATGAAVIVVPGGGHRVLAIEHEGHAVGGWLAAHGIAGFVLKYRLAREEGSTYQVAVHALQDTQRALRLVRHRATEWGVDPARVGVLGFSAGGELAALASVRYDGGDAGAADPVDRLGSRPDFQALLYPAIPQDMKLTKDTPPVFLACGYDDRPNISEGLATLYLAFKQAGVRAELHVYAGAGHGFGLRETDHTPAAAWPARLREWLGDRGFLQSRP